MLSTRKVTGTLEFPVYLWKIVLKWQALPHMSIFCSSIFGGFKSIKFDEYCVCGGGMAMFLLVINF